LYRMIWESPSPQNFTDLVKQLGEIWGDAAKDIASDLTLRVKNLGKTALEGWLIPLASIPLNIAVFGGMNVILTHSSEVGLSSVEQNPDGFAEVMALKGYNPIHILSSMEASYSRGDYEECQGFIADFLEGIFKLVVLYDQAVSELSALNLNTDELWSQHFYLAWQEAFGDVDQLQIRDQKDLDQAWNSIKKDPFQSKELVDKLYEFARTFPIDTTGSVTTIAGLAGKGAGVGVLPLIPKANLLFLRSGAFSQEPPNEAMDENKWVKIAWSYFTEEKVAKFWDEAFNTQPSGSFFKKEFGELIQNTGGNNVFNKMGNVGKILLKYAKQHAETIFPDSPENQQAFLVAWVAYIKGEDAAEIPAFAEGAEDQRNEEEEAQFAAEGKTLTAWEAKFAKGELTKEEISIAATGAAVPAEFAGVMKSISVPKELYSVMQESTKALSTNKELAIIVTEVIQKFAANDEKMFLTYLKKGEELISEDMTKRIYSARQVIYVTSNLADEDMKDDYADFVLFGESSKEEMNNTLLQMRQNMLTSVLLSIVDKNKDIKFPKDGLDVDKLRSYVLKSKESSEAAEEEERNR